MSTRASTRVRVAEQGGTSGKATSGKGMDAATLGKRAISVQTVTEHNPKVNADVSTQLKMDVNPASGTPTDTLQPSGDAHLITDTTFPTPSIPKQEF